MSLFAMSDLPLEIHILNIQDLFFYCCRCCFNDQQLTRGHVGDIQTLSPFPSGPDFPKSARHVVVSVPYYLSVWIFALKSEKVCDGVNLEIYHNP